MDKKRILIVNEDPETVWAIGRSIVREGFYVVAVTDGEEGLHLLERRNRFSSIILDMQIQGINGFVLLDHCRRYVPEAKTIVLLNHGDPVMKKMSLMHGADISMEKPVEIKFLVDAIAKGDTGGLFTGVLYSVDIIDYVQFVLFSRQQKVVEITSRTGERGTIYFYQGNVIHAEYSGKKGEEAFYECLLFEGGSFNEFPWQEPPERNINVPGEFLITEVIRKKDELRERKEIL